MKSSEERRKELRLSTEELSIADGEGIFLQKQQIVTLSGFGIYA